MEQFTEFIGFITLPKAEDDKIEANMLKDSLPSVDARQVF